MLAIKDLNAWYGESHVLHGVDIDVNRGELVTILGRNGAGKTTTLRAIMGILDKRRGSIRLNGQETVGMAPHRIPRLGVVYCPEERAVFRSLSVTENLMLPPRLAAGGMSLDEIYTLFPNLRERSDSSGGNLSGGEQQMLAIARGLMSKPVILLLDEPSLGLAPKIIDELFEALDRLRAESMTILLVDQMAALALSLADRAYVLESGRVAAQGTAAEIAEDGAPARAYLGA